MAHSSHADERGEPGNEELPRVFVGGRQTWPCPSYNYSCSLGCFIAFGVHANARAKAVGGAQASRWRRTGWARSGARVETTRAGARVAVRTSALLYELDLARADRDKGVFNFDRTLAFIDQYQYPAGTCGIEYDEAARRMELVRPGVPRMGNTAGEQASLKRALGYGLAVPEVKSEIRCRLGLVLHDQGDYGSAIAYLKQADRLVCGGPAIFWLLGHCYCRMAIRRERYRSFVLARGNECSARVVGGKLEAHQVDRIVAARPAPAEHFEALHTDHVVRMYPGVPAAVLD